MGVCVCMDVCMGVCAGGCVYVCVGVGVWVRVWSVCVCGVCVGCVGVGVCGCVWVCVYVCVLQESNYTQTPLQYINEINSTRYNIDVTGNYSQQQVGIVQPLN